MAAIGTTGNPMQSLEPMKVARDFVKGRFETETGKTGLVEFLGSYFEWYGGRWRARDKEWLKNAAWLWLEDAHYEAVTDGGPVTKRYAPVREEVNTIVECVTAIVRIERSGFPVWLGEQGEEDQPDMEHTVAFEDVLVDVKASVREGTLVTKKRDERWLDVSILPVCLVKEAECPIWMKSLDEWSGGDEEWKELLQRWMGYLLMGTRKYAKWLLLQGKIRGGKGTIVKVWRWFLGDVGYVGLRMGDLSDKHGLDGVQHARSIVISEVSEELDNREGDRVAALWKNILGNDPITVNPKNVRQIRNVVMKAAPSMLSNLIPRLPNKGRGLSSKMLVLPFMKSFEGREDFELDKKLKEEVEGIARWALEGALKLEKEERADRKFVTPKEGMEVIRKYHLHNNPFDAFLEARFRKNDKGFVATKIIWRQWYDWLKVNNVKIHVAKNMIVPKLEEETTWDLGRYRQPNGGVRGLKGLSLLEEYDDETT